MFILSSHAAASDKVLTIAADLWCPINCHPDDPRPGIGIELARHVFEPLGYRIEYTVMPWARALEKARLGQVAAVIGANREDDPSLIFPDEPIYRISDDFYMRKEVAVPHKGIGFLKGRRIGVIKGYGYSPATAQFLESQKKLPGMVQVVGGEDGLGQNIKKLLAGRIDVLIESKPVMDYTLNRLGLADRIGWAGGIPQGNVYLAFSPALKTSAEHARRYDEAVRQLSREERRALYGAYGLEEEQ